MDEGLHQDLLDRQIRTRHVGAITRTAIDSLRGVRSMITDEEWIDTPTSKPCLREDIEEALADRGCCNPDHRNAGLDPAVEVKNKPVSRKEKREAG